MNRKNTKKLLSVILSLVMVLSYLPASSFAFAVDGEAGPVVEADSNAGNDTTVNTDNGADTDTNTTDGSDQVTEGDKEDPPAVDDKKDEQAEPKEEGKKVEANTEAKEPAKGSEDEGEEPEGPANAPKATETTHTDLEDYLGTTPPLMTISLKHEDGRPITDDDPLVTGEMAILFMEVEEDYPSMVFDMDALTYEFPEGLYLVQPKTESNTIYVEDYDGNPQTMVNTYTISEDAVFTYTWNTEDADLYELACNAKNKQFSISNSLKIDDSTTLIDFGHGITYPVDNTGKLTVTKSVTGLNSMTEAQMKAMTFRVIDKATGQVPKDKDGNPREDCTFSLFDMTGNNLANKTYEVLKLPPGDYKVEEVGRPTIDGYTFMTSSSTTTDEATVHGGQGSTVNLSNVYAQDFGKLKLKKAFGEGSDLNDSNLSPAQKDKITFTVVGPNGPVTGSPFKYSQFTNGELNLEDLPIGTYTVTESANLEGYNRTTTYQVNNEPVGTGDAVSVEIAKNDNDVVTYTNSYEEKKGHLKIKKTFSGAGADRIPADQKKNVTFTVTGPNGYNETFTYDDFDADGVLDLGEVLTGTYKITESNADFPDYSVKRTTTITGADSTSGLTATSVVTEGNTDFPAFDNLYEEVGTLVITKNITGAYNNGNTTVKKATTFKVERKNSNGTWATVYSSISANSFTLVNGVLTYTIPNLPVGEYRVTETPYNNGSYVRTTTVTVDGNTTASTIGTDTVEYNQSATFAYENNYRRKQGTITINKKIFVDNVEIDLATVTAAELEAMGLTEDKQKAMKFTVKSGSTTYTVSLWDMLHPDDPDAKSNVVTVNTGTWTVTESGADFNDAYMRESSAKLDGNNSGMNVSVAISTDGQNRTVEYTNKYKKSGTIRLFKEITGALNSADQNAVKQQLRFKIKNLDTGEYVKDANGNVIEYTLAQITAEAGIELPVGNYQIEELYYEYKSDEYDVSVESSLTDLSMGIGDEISPTIVVSYGFQSYVYYENRYVKGPGPGVTVEKHVRLNGIPIDESVTDDELIAFDNAVKDQIKFRIVSTEKDDNGNPVYDETFTYRELESHTIMLPPGEYTITELDYQMTGYNHNIWFEINGQTVTAPSATFTVTKTTPLSIEVFDGYVEIGNLIIKKTFAAGSDITEANIKPDQKTKIIFTVTGYKSKQDDTVIFPTQTFNYSQMTDGQKLFENVPAGYYVVTESAGIDKYTWTYEWSEGTTDVQVVRGQTAEKSVANKYVRQKGILRVTKTLDGDTLDPDRSDLPNVSFTVRNKDANTPEFSSQFTYAEMSVDSNGNHYKQFLVPTGEYVVTETNADFGYYIRTSTVKVGSGSSEPYDETNGATGAVTYNQTTNIEITNKYEEAGHLIFKKTFKDDACLTKLTPAQKKKIKFIVYEGTKKYAEFTYADFDSATDSYTLLVRPDTEYIVYETMADITGYNRVTTVKVGDGPDSAYNENTGASAQVAVFTDKEVKFTNTYEERGKLKVTKTISGITEALTDEQKAAIQFTVKDPQGNILKNEQGEEIGRFTFADISTGGYTGSVTFDNLPAGTYTVSETVNDNAFYGRNRTTTVKVGNGAAQPYEEGDVDATVNLKGQQVAFTNSYDEADRLSVVKSDGGYPKGVGFVTIGGKKYPYWMFTLTIDNLTPDTTDEGVVDLTDIYDKKLTNLFRVLTTQQAIDANIPDAANANKLVPVGTGTAADVTLQPDYSNGKVVFHISGVNENTATTNKLTYYLVPKDADALGQLNTSDESDVSTDSMTVLKKFSNIVNYKPLPKLEEVSTNEVEYMYEHTNIAKECINYNKVKKEFFNPDNPDGPPVYYALYECIINPDGLRIGTEDYIDVTDTFSTNQSVNIDTVEFKRYDNSTNPPTLTDTQPGDILNPEINGHELSFKLKNEVAIRMTYRSQIAVSSADVGHPMVIENTLKVAGQEVTVVPEIIPDGTGHGSVVQIKLLKFEDKDIHNRLAGAEFKLYRDVNQSLKPDKQLLNPASPSGTFTTDANGEIIIKKYIEDGVETPVVANHNKHVTYFLEEVTPPQGYQPLGYILNCRLADTQHGETFDYTGPWYVYLPINDSVNVENTPYDVTYSLGALKDFETNGSARDLEEGEFTFKLEPVGDAPMPAGTSDGVITKSNDEDGKAVFGSVTLDYEDIVTKDENGAVTSTSKTYTYTVTEQPPEGGVDAQGNKDGVHYDLAPKTVTVTVSWNDADKKLDVDISGAALDEDDNVYFVGAENEYEAVGEWEPIIEKVLEGRDLEDQEFEFQIIDKDNNNKVVASGKNDATGKVTMVPSKIEFTTADLANNGINNFVIHENYTKTDHDGMTTVAADIPVKITVSEKDEYDGTLNVVADPTSTISSPYTFTNVYEATGEWTPHASKVLNGDLKLTAGQFYFLLKDENGNTLQRKPNKADGTVEFDTITYDENDAKNGGIHNYTISEETGTLFGVTYDDTEYPIQVKVETVKGSDQLKVTPTSNGEAFTSAEFTNEYNPTPAKAQPEYKKTLTGVEPPKDVEFEFKLEKAEGQNGDFDYVRIGEDPFTTQTETLTLGPSTLEKEGVFEELTFLAEGTYKFKITETPDTNGVLDSHIVYDPRVYTYTVEVTGVETSSGPELQATGTYSYTDEDNKVQTADTAAFTNEYTPTVITFTPKVHKVLDGERTVADKTFTFTMTPDADNPSEGAFHGNAAFDENAPETIELTVRKGEKSADEYFRTITFKKAGTYVFDVEEKIPATPVEDGITYDTIHWTWTIVIEDKDGDLEIVSNDAEQVGGSLTSDDGTTTFTNVYTPKPTKFKPPVKKVMEGEPLVDDKTFTFTIEADPDNPAGGAEIANDTTSITVPAGATSKDGAFDAITFKRAGTYNFTIKETTGNIQQIGYSQDVSYLEVVVKDTDPKLEVERFKFTEAATDDGSSAEFTNTYTPTPVDEVVPVEKTVPGEPLVKEKKFTFKLKPDEDNKKGGVFLNDAAFEGTAEDSVVLTVPAGEANAHDVFKTLTFKKAGTYNFTVSEVIPPEDQRYKGITYDETVGTVEIVVKDADLKLEVESMTFKKAVNEDGTAALFTNPYCPEPVDYTPQVEKTVSGHPTVAEKIFNFTLTPDAENKEGGVFISETPFEGEDAEDTTAVTVPAGEVNATADFSKLQFRKAGTYKFTVSELKEDEEGITYDEVVGTLTVTVEDMDGYLAETHEYVKNEETDKTYAKFDNDYTPEPVVEILHGYKVIDGEPQKDEEFTFKLESGGNTAQLPDGSYIPNPMPEEDEVTIYGDGEFEFGDMTYEWPGEYYYKISEAAGDAMGFTYDTAVWSVKVVVTDMDGYLEAETTYTSDLDGAEAEELAKFTNTYTTGELKITKTVKGETGDKSKKFKFTVRLYDKNGDPLEGVYPITGDAEGEVVNGVGTVKLAHGEEAFVTEIPVDATWTVEEEDYAKYTAKRDNDHGTITVDKKSESNWINTAPDGPDTGDHNTVGGYLGLFGTSIMALAAMIFGRRRRRENEE